MEQEPLEWSKETVWQKIEQRQHRKRKPVWWPFAAAAALAILMGGYVWFLAVPEVEKPAKNRVSAVATERKIKTISPVQIKSRIDDLKSIPELQRRESVLVRKAETKDSFIVSNALNVPAEIKNTPKKDSVLPIATTPEMPSIVENKPKERVLVVDIDLPDAPPADHLLKTTFLQRFSQQAKRLKTERKFDIKALDRRPGNGIWSFVGQSFVTPEAKN